MESKYNWLFQQKKEMLKNGLYVQIVDKETIRIGNNDIIWLEKERSIVQNYINYSLGNLDFLNDVYVYKIGNERNLKGYLIELVLEEYNVLYFFKNKNNIFELDITIKDEEINHTIPTFDNVRDEYVPLLLEMNKVSFEMLKNNEDFSFYYNNGHYKLMEGNPFDILLKLKRDIINGI